MQFSFRGNPPLAVVIAADRRRRTGATTLFADNPTICLRAVVFPGIAAIKHRTRDRSASSATEPSVYPADVPTWSRNPALGPAEFAQCAQQKNLSSA